MTAVKVIQTLATGIPDMTAAAVDIPGISWLYHLVAEGDLTVADLLRLVGAIPIAIISKLLAGRAPFADGQHTSEYINAPELVRISALLAGSIIETKPGTLTTQAGPGSVGAGLEPADKALAPCNICAFFGGLAAMVFAAYAREREENDTIRRGGAAVSGLVYLSPSIARGSGDAKHHGCFPGRC